MSACTKHAAEPVRGYSDCPGCEVESLRQQLAAAQAEIECEERRFSEQQDLLHSVIQERDAAQAEAQELRGLITEFACFTRDSGWFHVADELERRLAAIAPQPAERESLPLACAHWCGREHGGRRK